MNDWEFEYDGIAFGGDTSINVVEIDGLDDLPDIDTDDSPRFSIDGMWPGQDYARGRTITITLDPVDVDDATLAATLADLREVFSLRRSNQPALRFQMGGDITKRVYCRPRKRSMPLDLSRLYQSPRMIVQLTATDGRIYADAPLSDSASRADAGNGITFPATPPFSFGGAASGGSLQATNSGDWPAPWTATIQGPAFNPVITLADTGQRLSFTGIVALGSTLTLDSDQRTVMLNGASRYEWLDSGAEWFDLAPGDNNVQFSADSGAGTLTMYWRSTWL